MTKDRKKFRDMLKPIDQEVAPLTDWAGFGQAMLSTWV